VGRTRGDGKGNPSDREQLTSPELNLEDQVAALLHNALPPPPAPKFSSLAPQRSRLGPQGSTEDGDGPGWCLEPSSLDKVLPRTRCWPQPCLLADDSQNHRMFGVGRDLCGSSSSTPLPKQGHPEQAAQNLIQAGLEYLQRRRIHNPFGHRVPGLRHPQREGVLPHVQMELPLLQFVPVAPCPVAGHH